MSDNSVDNFLDDLEKQEDKKRTNKMPILLALLALSSNSSLNADGEKEVIQPIKQIAGVQEDDTQIMDKDSNSGIEITGIINTSENTKDRRYP